MAPESAQPVVGVVGLGAMGLPIAQYVVDAGLAVVCLDLDPGVVQTLVERGAEAAATLPELAKRTTVQLVFVPSDDDVRQVCLGDDGLLGGASAGSTIVVCSSARPDTCEELATAAAPKGVAVLDAALTGGVRGAESGQINLLVGGEQDVLDELRPVLAPWTKSVHHLGPLGAGQVGKTVNNMIHWAQICAITEALTLGHKLGVAPTRMRAALMDGPTDSRTLRELEYMRFTWHAKDLANALAMAETIAQPLPVAELAREVMKTITVQRVDDLLHDRALPAAAQATRS